MSSPPGKRILTPTAGLVTWTVWIGSIVNGLPRQLEGKFLSFTLGISSTATTLFLKKQIFQLATLTIPKISYLTPSSFLNTYSSKRFQKSARATDGSNIFRRGGTKS